VALTGLALALDSIDGALRAGIAPTL